MLVFEIELETSYLKLIQYLLTHQPSKDQPPDFLQWRLTNLTIATLDFFFLDEQS